MQPTTSSLRTLACLSVAVLFACSGGSALPPASNPPVNPPPSDGPPPGNPPGDQGDAGSPADDGGTVDPGTGDDAGTPADGGTAGVTAPSFTGLASGAVVSGHVGLNAQVPDGTAKVEFQLDGVTFAIVTAAPFSTTWDSFPAANGAHTLALAATDAAGAVSASDPVAVTLANHVKNVFVIVMENNDWSSIKGSSAAPYINGTLLAQGAHAEKYMNVPNLHPSLPNYIWLESGGTQGVSDDDVPANHRLTSTQHLTALMQNAGVTWKSYQEDIPGTNCPLNYVNQYGPKHNPMVYFTDVNGNADAKNAYCIQHIRPYGELQGDLEADTVPAYSFITPNLCNDMHDCGIRAGDTWLSQQIPKLMASKAYREGGLILVTWDESAGSNVPIGLIALSPMIKPGYSNTVSYTHSSTLRTIETIFGLSPLLGDAANATDLRDLFRTF